MAKVTDIDEAFQEHVKNEWSAKDLLNRLEMSWIDLREHIIQPNNWQSEIDHYSDQELFHCDECREHFDAPADIISVVTNDLEADYCEDCHKRLSNEGRI